MPGLTFAQPCKDITWSSVIPTAGSHVTSSVAPSRARAHARSGDPIALASYLGSGDSFDKAIVSFADAYADQNELDHRELIAAIDHGRVRAMAGV